jgi:predicted DNA-binding transcriptional regulator AlpA
MQDSSFSPKDRLLTEKQVAEWLLTSVAWLQRKRWEGRGIPYCKLGRSVRYAESDVLAYIEANKHDSTAA